MPIDLKLYQLLLATFEEELQELHQSLIDGLLALEKVTSKSGLENGLKELFRYSHNLKGAAGSASVDVIAVMAHRLEDLFSQWRTEYHFPSKDEISACLKVVDNLIVVLKKHINQEEIDVESYLKPLTGDSSTQPYKEEEAIKEAYIKLPISRIERVSAKADEFITHQLKLTNFFKKIEQPLIQMNQSKSEALSQSSLVKNLSHISRDYGQFLSEFSRSVQALQDELKSMRMVPLSTLLVPLSRTVRDLSTSLKKTVELRIEGGDIEIDKDILDAIKDPLQHLLRNAIDHGIESDAKRKKLNKPIPALLHIRISQISGHIKLEFKDDGKGIDIEKIKKQAIEQSIYTKDQIQKLNEQQLLNCIFISGFSMQKKITELSGRGVGLDVVKNSIDNVKGSLNVQSKLGHGTCFTLILPLTLSTTRGIFFKIKEHTFMLPTLSLTSVYEINPNRLKLVNNQYVLVIDDKPVPIKMMSQLLKVTPSSPNLHQKYYGFLIHHHEKSLVLLVDHIVDEQTCVIKTLPSPYSQLEHFIGVTLTGESTLVLVLDPSKLMQMALSEAQTKVRFSTETQQEITDEQLIKKRILVVDDSITTRVLCSNAIEMAGFEAITANDGKKAWELLQNQSFDCVITDIVMPEMDGFKLTQLIKKNQKLKHIPVIIVSLLDSQDSKQQSIKSGADAYIVKSEFNTPALLKTIKALL